MMLSYRWMFVAALVASAGCRDREPRRGPQVATVAPAAAVAATVTARSAAPSSNDPPAVLTPYIPPQCYVRTQDAAGGVHNPCFGCHVDAAAPNYLIDGALQASYAFAPPARRNPWTNLFVDRRAAVDAITDDAILAYVRHDNYAASATSPGLAARLASPTPAWDADGDGRWSGWLPDVAFRFDDGGFDRSADGGYTGWRAYTSYPLVGSFWPTNGSFGDVMIRLPAAFREDAAGRFDRGIYAINLAIVEALIGRRDVAIDAADERALGVDLDGDGRLARARRIRYRWKPGGGGMRWAGRAGELLARGEVHLAAGLFPEGTELAHSVRYLDVVAGADGTGARAVMAPRMKELRYMAKAAWVTYGTLEQQAVEEAAEKSSKPDMTRRLIGSAERGIGNRAGWRLQGFIEDAAGELRPQTLDEHGYCIGCHSGVGATDDSVFSFGRKLPADGFQRGWFHPGQRGLDGVAEPVRADGRGEYTLYLEQNRAGDDLRANDEVLARFFDEQGALRPDMQARLHADISTLLVPSPARALRLDKAYTVIVGEQSFTRGRDATVTPAVNVHRELPEEELATGVALPVTDRRRP